MSVTITELGAVAGRTFSGRLRKYVETSPSTTWYTVEGASLDGTPLALIVAPATYYDANPSRWPAFYAATIDTLLGAPTAPPDLQPTRDGI